MRYLDLRLCTIVLINTVKSPHFQIGGGGVSWDLIMTWSNIFSFFLVLSAFSFISIEVPFSLTLFTRSFPTFHIRLRFGNRPLPAAASFMASLILPQPVFLWYVYPLMVLLFFFPIPIPISVDQVYDIFITATTTPAAAAVEVMNEPQHPQQADDEAEPNSERETPLEDLEANIEAS